MASLRLELLLLIDGGLLILVRLLLPLGEGQGDDLIPLLLEAHDDDALGSPAGGADGIHMSTDQDAALGDQQQVL